MLFLTDGESTEQAHGIQRQSTPSRKIHLNGWENMLFKVMSLFKNFIMKVLIRSNQMKRNFTDFKYHHFRIEASYSIWSNSSSTKWWRLESSFANLPLFNIWSRYYIFLQSHKRFENMYQIFLSLSSNMHHHVFALNHIPQSHCISMIS